MILNTLKYIYKNPFQYADFNKFTLFGGGVCGSLTEPDILSTWTQKAEYH